MVEHGKSILSEVVYKKTMVHKDDVTIKHEYYFDHVVKSFAVDELIEYSSPETIEIGNLVKENSKRIFKENNSHLSKQQAKFYNDCTRLIFSALKVQNPILLPVRCGFGKSTFIKTLIGTIIEESSLNGTLDNNLPMIITTNRIEDLKELSDHITEKYGYYSNITTFEGVTKKVPYIYVLEGWNENIECRNYKKVSNYNESLVRCTREKCDCFDNCKIGIQRKEQFYSPILSMTNDRLSIVTNTDEADKGINRFTTFINKGQQNKTRTRLLIDEKPKLLSNKTIGINNINQMKSLVDRFDSSGDEDIDRRKLDMLTELNHIEQKILQIQDEFLRFKNAFISLNEEIFSEKFKENWFKFFHLKYNEHIQLLENMFRNGALWCKSKDSMFFRTVTRNIFNVGDLHTFIFDGTAEMSLEYETGKNDFVYLDIDDYKQYDYVTFHIIQENFSRNSIKSSPSKLQAVCDWINENIHDKAYVISYRDCDPIPVNDILTERLKSNNNIVMSRDKNILPYFGNTKGKNDWNNCTSMVQIGWNRYSSDVYIAEYLASNSKTLKQIRENYQNDKFRIPELLFGVDQHGHFTFNGLEQYRLMKMIVDFEQEAFRTKIREFSSNEEVHIYLFTVNEAMRSMIQQRFKGCKFVEHTNIKQFKEVKKLTREGNEDVKRLVDWIDTEWDKKKIESKKVRDLLQINDNSWKYIFNRDQVFREILKEKRVKQKKMGKQCFLIKY